MVGQRRQTRRSHTRTRCTRFANAYYVEREFDEPRIPGHVRPTLFIGPPRQRGGALLEVMVELVEPRDIHVFHVMPARAKHLERMEDRT